MWEGEESGYSGSGYLARFPIRSRHCPQAPPRLEVHFSLSHGAVGRPQFLAGTAGGLHSCQVDLIFMIREWLLLVQVVKEKGRDRERNPGWKHSLLQHNLESDILSPLPHPIGHTDQPWRKGVSTVRWEHWGPSWWVAVLNINFNV